MQIFLEEKNQRTEQCGDYNLKLYIYLHSFLYIYWKKKLSYVCVDESSLLLMRQKEGLSSTVDREEVKLFWGWE